MTEIGMLIMGEFNDKQTNLPQLLDERPLKAENDQYKTKNSHFSQLTHGITSKITAPEFMTVGVTEKIAIAKPQALSRTPSKRLIAEQTPAHIRLSYGYKWQQASKRSNNRQLRPQFQLADRSNLPKPKFPSRDYLAYNRPQMPTLRFGDSGLSIRVLQRLLISNGYNVRVDGVFGALTETAIKAFQSQRNLSVDGIVGPKTWSQLCSV
ncbi:peptidoglycan-binding protein [Cylindrospermopsis raciborskii S07]|uniref:Peptidoglycan-binding protein n=3 Tax=Cylindrospermopsis raciborskii TaxID=77022 RepID=A0A853MJW0_9CYAN|nr:peptidoglycan-binding domain-containing protein [Cylindrospermopsis raciborskii]EFA69451.1 Peptidoglycan-binding domain protein 1 [Cylindrospermopsis raciborskii CS-505]MBA4446094.1 peptidoglycan-binding protein [Cylindrospermopsis raciborskii CS-506_C]MBA4450323.1 peptidoglycan-binding protein [Cylindrospermopsis raciborskii CS-506_D]MBA4456950.1 peptidoglycan-binding protein [Cylindrospermopsis raciborskii CS-506_B]MBA4466303.1 peptidoglycan-binding protein [Cylindrospermopsis raciborskii